MAFTIRIETDDDAIVQYGRAELVRILRECADRILAGEQLPMRLMDVNGNDVGVAR